MFEFRSITIRDIWVIFASHIVPIILAACAACSLPFLYSKYKFVPEYDSTATIYVLRQDNSTQETSAGDFSLAMAIVTDCTYMIKSHEILDPVIEKLDLNMRYEGLYNRISINNPSNTRILEVTVRNPDPALAKQIVDEICVTAKDKINKTMGINKVNVYSKGNVATSPSNYISVKKYVKYGAAAAIFVYAIYVVIFILDDKIKTEDDVQKQLGVSVLGDIPNSNAARRRKKKYGYYYYGSDSGKKSKKRKYAKGGKE